MVTSGSTIDIDHNVFINNAARYSGGVMVTYNDTFTIHSTTYTNNSAHNDGGVMTTFCNSSFDISNSIFSNNSADFTGGVIHTYATVLHSKRVDFEHGVISAVFPSHTCNYIVLFW